MKWHLRTLEQRLVASLDRWLGYPRERRRFEQRHGYPLNLHQPRSFSEKICWKKLFDRNPLLPVVADKFRVRDYVVERLGEAAGREVLVPLLAVLERPEDLDLDALPERFVIKSSHGSGNNWLVDDKAAFDRSAFLREARRWMTEAYGLRNHEWAYDVGERRILVEQMLLDESGSVPADYKLNMIHGQCAFIQVDQGRFGEFRRSVFDADWNYQDVKVRRAQGPDLPRPANLDRMLELARTLAEPFDFIRVDLYSVDGQLYVGELTNYPARGWARISPTDFDFELGRNWQLPAYGAS